jgi:hypothetical protein
MIGGMLLLGVSFFFIPPLVDNDDPANVYVPGFPAYTALLGMLIFCAAYALGLGNVAWVVQSEVDGTWTFGEALVAEPYSNRKQVFSHELRAIGTSFATGAFLRFVFFPLRT